MITVKDKRKGEDGGGVAGVIKEEEEANERARERGVRGRAKEKSRLDKINFQFQGPLPVTLTRVCCIYF